MSGVSLQHIYNDIVVKSKEMCDLWPRNSKRTCAWGKQIKKSWIINVDILHTDIGLWTDVFISTYNRDNIYGWTILSYIGAPATTHTKLVHYELLQFYNASSMIFSKISFTFYYEGEKCILFFLFFIHPAHQGISVLWGL